MRISKLLFLLLITLLLAGAAAVYQLLRIPLAVTSIGAKKITVVLRTTDSHSEFWQTVSAGAKAAAKETSAQLQIIGPLRDNDIDGQAELLEQAIQNKPQVIVLAPAVSGKLSHQIDQIKKAGIQLVIIDSPINGYPDLKFISNNDYEDGRQAGLAAITDIKGAPKVALISDRHGSKVTSEREQGVFQSIPTPSEQLLGTYYNDNSEDKAAQITRSLLQENSGITSIVALSESAKLGAAKAIKERNVMNPIKLIAFYNSTYDIKLMEQGTLDAVIVQKPFNIGYLGVKTGLQMIEGKKTDNVTYIDSSVVTQTDMYTPQSQNLLFPLVEK